MGIDFDEDDDPMLDLHHRLIDAIERNDVIALRAAVAAGAPINGPHPYDEYRLTPPLCKAAALLHADCFLALLELGADTKPGPPIFSNVLASAILSDRACDATMASLRIIVQAAVAHGAPVNRVNKSGDTPLLHMLSNPISLTRVSDSPKIMRDKILLLIECGADPRMTNAKGENAYDLVREMVGLNKILRDGWGMTLRMHPHKGQTHIASAADDFTKEFSMVMDAAFAKSVIGKVMQAANAPISTPGGSRGQ